MSSLKYKNLIKPKEDRFLKLLGYVEKIIIIIGFPFAIYQYVTASEKEKKDRDYVIYNSLGDKYNEWENLCLSHTYLDIADIKDSVSPQLNEQQKKEEIILFQILFSMLERAYLLFNEESSTIKKDQWPGWDLYIENYCERKNFRQVWTKFGWGYESSFTKYMNDKIKRIASK